MQKFTRQLSARLNQSDIDACFRNIVFIVSAPRAGSTLLFDLLSRSPEVWTIGGESHGVYAQFPHLVGENTQLTSGRLTARHADKRTCRRMKLLYLSLARNVEGRPLFQAVLDGHKEPVVFLEKTPRNSLNIDFLQAVFPEARYVYLRREPRGNISSIMEGWDLGGKSGEFVTFRNLPDWSRGYWCFLLPPGWQAFNSKPVVDIAAFQWQACNEIIVNDLSKLSPDRWTSVSYSELVDRPAEVLQKLCDFCNVDMGEFLRARNADNLPLSASTITPPKKEKWKRHEVEITAVLPGLQQTIEQLESLEH